MAFTPIYIGPSGDTSSIEDMCRVDLY